MQLGDASTEDGIFVSLARSIGSFAEFGDGRDICRSRIELVQSNRGEGRNADQHAHHARDDEQGARDAVDVIVGRFEQCRIDRSDCQSETDTGEDQRNGLGLIVEGISVPGRHVQERDAAEHHGEGGEVGGADVLQQPPAKQGTDRKGDEKTDQHERSIKLRIGKNGQSCKEGDVDEGRDEGGTNEERHHERTPGRSRVESAPWNEWCSGVSLTPCEADEGEGGQRQQDGRVGGDGVAFGFRGREGDDDGAEPECQQQSAQKVGLAADLSPTPPTQQRFAGESLSHEEQDEQAVCRQGQGAEPT